MGAEVIQVPEVKGVTLPYRSGGQELIKFIEARGRGHTLDKIQTLGFPGKAFQGTLLAARELGLMKTDDDDLTDAGSAIALATEGAHKKKVLLNQILSYEPFARALESLSMNTASEATDLSWFETWWTQAKYGASANNRSEASLTFASLLDYVGLGAFIRGRRGHSSRVVWTDNAFDEMRDALYNGHGEKQDQQLTGADLPPLKRNGESEREAPDTLFRPSARNQPASPAGGSEMSGDESNTLSLRLTGGRSIDIRLPHTLTKSEKQRLIKLIELMVEEREADDPVIESTVSATAASLNE